MPSAAVLRIEDVDIAGTIQFAAAQSSTGDRSAAATITVTRSGGTASGVSVHYATADGTAMAGVDYVSASGELSFCYGEGSKTFTVPILDDGIENGAKSLTLLLSSPDGGGAIGTPSSSTLWIVEEP